MKNQALVAHPLAFTSFNVPKMFFFEYFHMEYGVITLVL
jgi:hypothetical protein